MRVRSRWLDYGKTYLKYLYIKTKWGVRTPSVPTEYITGKIVCIAIIIIGIWMLTMGCIPITTASIPAQRDPSYNSIPKLGSNDGTSISY